MKEKSNSYQIKAYRTVKKFLSFGKKFEKNLSK